ncbi:MAG: hypothetical protein Q8R02_19615 [Hyphomonadaceae bacterium]|nr:hypothetical protein [Hyphomonadaceae bacterium]
MVRTLFFVAIVLSPLHAVAQAPGAEVKQPRVVKVHAELKTGAKVEIRQPDIINESLCGFVIPEGAPADAAPKAQCIPRADISSTRVEGVGAALAESIDGSLCAVLMPLCLAKVSAVQNRIVEKAIDKAGAK